MSTNLLRCLSLKLVTTTLSPNQNWTVDEEILEKMSIVPDLQKATAIPIQACVYSRWIYYMWRLQDLLTGTENWGNCKHTIQRTNHPACAYGVIMAVR